MIKKIIILALLLVGIYAKAQKISGTISNLENKLLVFSWTADFLIYEKDSVFTDDKGNFSTSIYLNRPGYLTLRNQAFLSDDIYLWPNSTLTISADGASGTTYYKSRKYNGSAEKINNFLASLSNSSAIKAVNFDSETYKLPEAKFVQTITSYFLIRDSLRKADLKSNTIDKNDPILIDFLLIDSINMAYFKSSVWFSYLSFLNEEHKERFYLTHLKLMEIQNENESYLSSPHYRYFWNNLVDYKLKKIRKSLPSEQTRTAAPYYQNIPHLIETNLNGRIKQIAASSYLSNILYFRKEMDENELEMSDTAINKLYRLLKNQKIENHYKKLFSQTDEFRLLTRKGLIATDINIIDTSGKTYSLKDFIGKIIYIDLWASWCVPCIAEIPDTKELLAAIKSPEKLAYLSISLDDKKNDWMYGVKKHNPPGKQFWAIDGFKSKLAEDYKITGIPHYILIDEHGKLLNYSAPRPSSGAEIIDLINAAIKNIKH